jgi:hypothetical protein
MSKKLISSSVVFLLITFKVLYGQNCIKVDKVDKITNQRIIETSEYKTYGSKIFDGHDNFWGFYVFFSILDDKLYFSINDYGKYHVTQPFEYIILKLSNDSLLDLSNYRAGGAYRSGNSISTEKSFLLLNKKEIELLKNYNITFIRFSPGASPMDAKIDKSLGDRIRKDINCIWAKLPPNYFQNLEEINSNENKSNVIDKIPVASSSDTIHSINKQWKLAAILDSSGLPRKLAFNKIIKLNNNGEFKQTIIFENGKVVEMSGTYNLINEGKLLMISFPKDNISQSLLIGKLTKTELILKASDHQSIYTSY